MSTIAEALADNSKLSPYKGHDVLKTSIKLSNAGDGLSKSMGVEPAEYEIGDPVVVVLECVVADHKHKQIDGTDALELVQNFSARLATIVDRSLVAEALDRQKRTLELAAEAKVGVGRMLDDEALSAAHGDGLHAAKLVPGCPECLAESDAVAAEEAEYKARQAEAQIDAPTPLAGRRRAKKSE